MEVNKMNTKEAIEWLRDAEKAAELNEWRIDSIISLLNQGEAYRQMWEKIRKGNYLLVEFGKDNRLKENHFTSEFEQKYLKEECNLYKECYRCGQEYTCMIKKNSNLEESEK